MFFAFTGMYQTFVHKRPVVQIIHPKPLALNTTYGAVQVDSSVLGQIFNLALFALFMIFLASLGGKIAGVGNQLLKTERICETLKTLRAPDVVSNEKEIKKL